jgi:hypothetical protein
VSPDVTFTASSMTDLSPSRGVVSDEWTGGDDTETDMARAVMFLSGKSTYGFTETRIGWVMSYVSGPKRTRKEQVGV